MRTARHFEPSDRYRFDFSRCSLKKGWAQVDTSQDASYYGTWAHPERRQIVNYCEGDVTIQTAETDEEFAKALLELKAWCEKMGMKFFGIDCGLRADIVAGFERVGVADLLH